MIFKKSIIFISKILLSIITLYFFMLILMENIDKLSEIDFKYITVKKTLLLILFYLFGVFFMAFGWHKILLIMFDGNKISLNQSAKVFFITFIGKYIPGNVAHFAGRTLYGSSILNLSKINIFSTIVVEIYLLIFCSFIISLFFFEELNSFYLFFNFKLSNQVIYLSIVFLFFGFVLFNRYINNLHSSLIFFKKLNTKAIFAPCLFFVIYLVFNAFIFYECLSFFNNEITLGYTTILPIFIFSWLVGFISPGAPAGLGVRELLLTLLISNILPIGIVIFSTIIYRFINIIGDFLILCIGMGIPTKRS